MLLNILPIETFNSKTRTCRFNKVSVFSLPKLVFQIRTHVLQLKFAKSFPSAAFPIQADALPSKSLKDNINLYY